MSRMFNAINHSRRHLFALGLYVIFFVLFFSPVIIRNHILAPGDGANFYYPAFKRGFSLWSKFILSGYPTALDPQFILGTRSDGLVQISISLSFLPTCWPAFCLMF